MLIADYVDYWTVSNLITWEEASLGTLHLPNTIKNFLRNIGLPSPGRRIGPWRIDWITRSDSGSHEHSFILLANNYGFPQFYLDDVDNSVVSYQASEPSIESSTPVNSNLELFAFSLTALDKRRGLRYDNPDYESIVHDFELELKSIDPKAMEDEDNLWVNMIWDWRFEGGITVTFT